MDEIARSCGWWWPFENAVILTERPTEIHRDDQGRLHNEAGPALLYPDGWGVWAIHGLRLDRRIIDEPETLTFAEVRDEENAEIRRHMLERFGGLYDPSNHAPALQAWIDAGGLEPVSSVDITHKMQPSGLAIWRMGNGDKPVTCDLYRTDLRDDEPLNLLLVRCTSTAKAVSLRVPPYITSARDALNWTFGGVDLTDALET